MNSINRLKECWIPNWDLGTQDEFGFSLEVKAEERPKLEQKRPNAWSMASREVLNRQTPSERSLSGENVSQEELVSFLEALTVEIANDEQA